MNKQKELWESLSRKNANYYIYTPGGKNIHPVDYRNSGFADYKRIIKDDKLIIAGGTILDFACGNGRMTEFMIQDFDHVIGTDISEEMIIGARERLGEGMYSWHVTNGYTLDIDSNYVDIVLAAYVFPHMKEPEMVESNFQEINRVLVPGGIFKVYMKNDLGKDKDNDLSKWWNGVTYTERSARAIAETYGFEVLKVEYIKHNTNYWMWLKKNV